jgi:hypothetical protein
MHTNYIPGTYTHTYDAPHYYTPHAPYMHMYLQKCAHVVGALDSLPGTHTRTHTYTHTHVRRTTLLHTLYPTHAYVPTQMRACNRCPRLAHAHTHTHSYDAPHYYTPCTPHMHLYLHKCAHVTGAQGSRMRMMFELDPCFSLEPCRGNLLLVLRLSKLRVSTGSCKCVRSFLWWLALWRCSCSNYG